jgi:hypothetical protein
MILKGLYLIVFNHSGYEQLTGAGSSQFAKPFRKHLLQSMVGSGFAIVLAVGVAAVGGSIEWSSPVAWNKAVAMLGVFFSAWGTWFGVCERSESWKKSRLDERLRDVVFIGLFVPGVTFGTVGTLL